MKNFLRHILTYYSVFCCFAAAVTSFYACDNIDEQDRLQYIKPTPTGRCILIEDYTGQDCVNCPTATAIIEELQATYSSDTIIAVSIHSGNLGVKPSEKHPDGLATDLGDRYYDYWNIEYQPMGVIDRSDGALDKDWWTAKVSYDLQQPQSSRVNIEVTTAYIPDTRTLDIEVDVIGAEGNTDGKLQLWLTEDHVTAFQKMPDKTTNTAYEHNHVLRDAINGDWGEELRVAEGGVKHFSHTYRVNSAWQAQNLSIVAFVYNGDGVVQAKKVNIEN